MQAYPEVLSKIVPSVARYLAYQALVFADVPLAGRRVLDVGGGSGIMSFYAACRGAPKVVCLDPLEAGSNEAMEHQYQSFARHVGGPVTRIRERLQDWEPDQVFDVVLVHNAINHLDEDACERMGAADARESYLAIFAHLRSLLASGGHLVLTDCARRNLWGDLGLPNVFAPTIDWRIHQQPHVWDALMIKSGFQPGRIRWIAPSRIRRPGQLIFGNRLGGYLTNSFFVLTSRA
jgi:SAM-dependent methyltransferase